MLPLLTKTKTDVMREKDDDSYYLVYIGTKPNARSRGYATKLLQHMIRKVRQQDTQSAASSDSAQMIQGFAMSVLQ